MEAGPPRINPTLLIEAATEKSDSDWNKAVRGDTMTDRGRKQIAHSIRVPMFAQQILRHTRITDFECMLALHEEIVTDPSPDTAHYAEVYGPIRADMLARLRVR